MKFLTLTLIPFLLTLAFNARASTRDVEVISFTGAGSNKTLLLSADKTHTEYRTEVEARTCWRQEVYYQQVCRPNGPGLPPTCYTQPVYRSVPYTCYVNVQVPYEVFDYHVQASVDVRFGDVPAGLTANERVTVALNGDVVSLSAVGTKSMVMELSGLDQAVTMNGNVKNIAAIATIDLHDVAPVKEALQMTQASVKKSVLTYTLGPVDGVKIKHSLKLAKNPLIGSSTLLFKDRLGEGVLTREANGNNTSFKVAFKDLIGRVLGNGRYDVVITADFDAGVSVINDRDLGGLATQKSILYRISK